MTQSQPTSSVQPTPTDLSGAGGLPGDPTVLSDIARSHGGGKAGIHEAPTLLPGAFPANADAELADATDPTKLPAQGPQRIGRYELLSKLGEGGMGEVYKARDTEAGTIVALKRILSDGGGAGDRRHDSKFRALFRREADRLRKIEHPNIIRVLDVGETPTTEGGELYYVMEFMGGGSLAKHKGQKLPPKQVAEIGAKIADALVSVANDHGLVHRDIKPENILLRESGDPVLADFGIVHSTVDSSMLGNNSVGTPLYMAPEIARGEKGSYTADIYSLGAVLYYLASGRKPYDGDSVEQVRAKVLAGPPRPITDIAPELPADLVKVIQDAMAHQLRQRYAETKDFLADLKRFLAGEPVVGARDVVVVAPEPGREVTPGPKLLHENAAARSAGAANQSSSRSAPSRGTGFALVGAALGLVAIVTVGGAGAAAWWWWPTGGSEEEKPSGGTGQKPSTPVGRKPARPTPPDPSPKTSSTDAESSWRELAEAIRQHQTEVVERVLSSLGAQESIPANVPNPARLALDSDDLETLKMILKAKVVRVHWVDSADGSGLLHDAASKDAKRCLAWLIDPKSGADARAIGLPIDVDQTNRIGRSALHLAVEANATSALDVLLKAGANPLLKDDAGRTPWHLIRQDGLAIVDLVRKHPLVAEIVNAQDKSGATPLHQAAALNRDEVLRALRDCPGVRDDVRNNDGQTWREVAGATDVE